MSIVLSVRYRDDSTFMASLFRLKPGGDWGPFVNLAKGKNGSLRIGRTVLEWVIHRRKSE